MVNQFGRTESTGVRNGGFVDNPGLYSPLVGMVPLVCMCLSPAITGSTNEYNEISEDKILRLAPVLKTTENNSISDNTLNNATLRREGTFAQEDTS